MIVERRTMTRPMRRDQVANGTRPKRDPKPPSAVPFLTVNASAMSTFMSEFDNGTVLHKFPLTALQEHVLGDGQDDAARSWLKQRGMHGVI